MIAEADARAAAVVRMEALGRAGVTVSVCCGPLGGSCGWSVDVLSPHGQTFQRPFAARDFVEAIEIAALEALERGWLTSQEG